MFDGKAFGAQMTEIVKAHVESVTAPLLKRIEELEARKPEKGEKGDRGDAGERGETGKDGRGVKELLIDRDGQLVATMEDGELKSLGPVVGRDGTDGKDGRDGVDGRHGEKGDPGRDGIELTSFDAVVLDDDRTIELKFASGDEERVASFKWPTMIYRQVFRQGEEYEPGDVVTWGGNLWHCNEKTSEKPDQGPWTLAAKKGRDGKDAKPNG